MVFANNIYYDTMNSFHSFGEYCTADEIGGDNHRKSFVQLLRFRNANETRSQGSILETQFNVPKKSGFPHLYIAFAFIIITDGYVAQTCPARFSILLSVVGNRFLT